MSHKTLRRTSYVRQSHTRLILTKWLYSYMVIHGECEVLTINLETRYNHNPQRYGNPNRTHFRRSTRSCVPRIHRSKAPRSMDGAAKIQDDHRTDGRPP